MLRAITEIWSTTRLRKSFTIRLTDQRTTRRQPIMVGQCTTRTILRRACTTSGLSIVSPLQAISVPIVLVTHPVNLAQQCLLQLPPWELTTTVSSHKQSTYSLERPFDG